MHGGYIFSGLLHLAVILIAVLGLPALFEPDEIQQPIPVQIVDIAEVTTPPKQEKKPKPAPVKPTPPKPEPPQKAESTPPPAPPAPPVEAEPEPPAPEPVVAPPPEPVVAPPPEPVVAPPPESSPKTEPKKAETEPLPIPEAKPEPPKRPEKKVAKKEPAKPKPPEKKPAEKKEEPAPKEFASVLKDLEQELRQEVASRPTPDPEPTPEAQSQERNLSEEPLTISEIDAIRAQIERCWNVPVGARDAENLIVEIRVRLNPDGSVYAMPEILDTRRMASDPFFRAAAESAQRAVLKCSPLRMPAKKYNVWKEVTLRFDPSQMF